LRFDPPAGPRDQSVIALAGEDLSITLARDELSGRSLDAYAEESAREVAARMAGFRAGQKRRAEVAGSSALIAEHEARDADGAKLAQAQAFVVDGSAVLVVTATCADASRARTELDKLLATLTRGNA
jgi:hypothetical protein